jgi:uncharacterized cupin superfamily protein
MKKLDLPSIPVESGCNYPVPFDAPCLGATWQRLGKAAGLTHIGVRLSRLPPGIWSSQRHWHSHEDEFVMVIEGELVLVTNGGEEILRPGDCAGFRAGEADGHHLINRAACDAVILSVSNTDDARDRCVYADLDMVAEPGEAFYRHHDGTAYRANPVKA